MPRRGRLSMALALGATLLAGGCEESREATGGAGGKLDFTGVFEVDGFTVVRRSEERRPIAGTVIIAHREGPVAHVATFSLETELSGPDGSIEAEVFGSAEAERSADELHGTAETQLLLASVPGIDASFPFIPGRLGPKIVSSFQMTPDPEEAGSFRIEIENEAAEGQAYQRTRTTLRARRTAASPEAFRELAAETEKRAAEAAEAEAP